MPKQPAEPKKPEHVPDRAVLLARKQANQRVEELKLRLVVLVDKYFEQSLRIIQSWMKDEKENAAKKR